jgi:hypothetical protein
MQKYSHGKDITYIIKSAIEVIEFVKSKGIEVRFSSEDSFRSDLVDLLSIYRAVDKIGVNRVGIADTVGCANPRQVYDLVRTLRGVVSCDIECHFHDDSGCGEFSVPRLTLQRDWALILNFKLSCSCRQCFLRSRSRCHTCGYFSIRYWGTKWYHRTLLHFLM